MSAKPLPIQWVDSDKQLAKLSQTWQAQSAIALDTEFIRSRTFYPKTGLIQLADNYGIYLVDPLAIKNKEPLSQLLINPNVTKVIHACSEDLEVFNDYLKVMPSPLFDTQIAAAFAGYGASIGYASLVGEVLKEEVPKHETRSDWLQRPLSQSQKNYAALDVQYLLAVYEHLVESLTQQQRLTWVKQDCNRLLEKVLNADSTNHYYLRIKSAWKCRPNQLAVLQQLSRWREITVREINIPRNRLIKDSSLLDMAQKLPDSLKKLRGVIDIHPKFVDKYGEHCLALIEAALAETDLPEALPPPLSIDQVEQLRQLKAKVKNIADTLHIPAQCLASKKELESLLRKSQEKSIVFEGWRKDIVGKHLQVLMEQL